MIYTQENTPRDVSVHVVGESLKRMGVYMIDTDDSTIHSYHEPLIVNSFGQLESFEEEFSAIHPIFGGRSMPMMFLAFPKHDGE